VSSLSRSLLLIPLQAAKCIVGKDYPKPIVEHATIHKENMGKMKAAYGRKLYGNAKAAGGGRVAGLEQHASTYTGGAEAAGGSGGASGGGSGGGGGAAKKQRTE